MEIIENKKIECHPLPVISEKRKDNFWSRVALTANDNLCWNWIGWVKDTTKPSYGVILINGSKYSTHRIAYYLNFWIDPKELYVLHKCDNPQCVNPKHLFLGTHQDNMADKIKKGRQSRTYGWGKGRSFPKRMGSKGSAAKLIESQVLEIRKQFANGVSCVKLGRQYGVAKNTILKMIHRKTWRHI